MSWLKAWTNIKNLLLSQVDYRGLSHDDKRTLEKQRLKILKDWMKEIESGPQ